MKFQAPDARKFVLSGELVLLHFMVVRESWKEKTQWFDMYHLQVVFFCNSIKCRMIKDAKKEYSILNYGSIEIWWCWALSDQPSAEEVPLKCNWSNRENTVYSIIHLWY